MMAGSWVLVADPWLASLRVSEAVTFASRHELARANLDRVGSRDFHVIRSGR